MFGRLFSERIANAVHEFEPRDLIGRFDVDFDALFRHEYAIGVLRMLDAFLPGDGSLGAEAVRVGAHWCAIVRADVEYELRDGLRFIEASRGGADRLREALAGRTTAEDTVFAAYVLARWHDGVGKIYYRLGTFARAREYFATAVEVATTHDLAWCRSDLVSNLRRAGYEELRQSVPPDTVVRLEEHAERLEDLAGQLEHDIGGERSAAGQAERVLRELTPGDEPPVPDRELLRGHSSLLHNLAFARKELRDVYAAMAGQRRKQDLPDEAADHQRESDEQHRLSVTASGESMAISRVLRDEYRIGQSLNHQAVLAREGAADLFAKLAESRWRRGTVIARQRQALAIGGEEGLGQIRTLIADEARQAEAGDGIDVSIYAYSVDTLEKIVDRMPKEEAKALRDEVIDARIRLAESVRGAVSLPSYKRQYATSVRPGYLRAVGRALEADDPAGRSQEEAFRLTEESTGRELLDMLAAAALPRTDDAVAARPTFRRIGGDGRRRPATAGTRGARRSDVRVLDQAAPLGEMNRRATEFEERFLRQPLDAIRPDPEIAHLMRRHVVNNRGTGLVRYATYDVMRRDTRTRLLGAFVIRGSTMQFRELTEYRQVADLLGRWEGHAAPDAAWAAKVWDLLVEPIWDLICPKHLEADPATRLAHLVVVPTDDLYLIPMHLACPARESVPLAARVPLSFSVSATAYVARGRNLLKLQPVDENDDLTAIIVRDAKVSGDEIVGTGWDEQRHLYVMGDAPEGLHAAQELPPTFGGLAAISHLRPEFLIYAGHGNLIANVPELGPYLQLSSKPEDIITQFDIALRLRLPRNKLTVLGACVAGRSAQTAGGDVGGFLRALMAAGAGAIAVPLWQVRDDAMVETVNRLLKVSREAAALPAGTFDVVRTLHEHYQRLTAEHRDDEVSALLEKMPLSVFL